MPDNAADKDKKKGLFAKIKDGLSKTRRNIAENIESVIKAFTGASDEFYEELEEALIAADIGVATSMELIARTRAAAKAEKTADTEAVRAILIREITKILEADASAFELPTPSVVLVIGVNGVGKTTTIGKLASIYRSRGKKVLLAAADTFRAAAIDQLKIWGERSSVQVIAGSENSDPAAVVFDAVSAAKARKCDILICDTAGRLQNKKNLMDELNKIFRVISREYSEARLEVLMVLDATTGQNALAQALAFKEICGSTGIVLTKLDGTAKGGIIIAIKNELRLPVRFVGIGEQIDDLREFDAAEFAAALFSTSQE